MTNVWHGGKGSASRPIKDHKKFEDNWDAIFTTCKECGMKVKEHKPDCSKDAVMRHRALINN